MATTFGVLNLNVPLRVAPPLNVESTMKVLALWVIEVEECVSATCFEEFAISRMKLAFGTAFRTSLHTSDFF